MDSPQAHPDEWMDHHNGRDEWMDIHHSGRVAGGQETLFHWIPQFLD
jgi:hypothetical protein